MTPTAETAPESEDERLEHLHRRLDEAIGPGHASTLMTCLRPGGWRLVTSEEWGGLHVRLCEVLGKKAADMVFASLWQIVYSEARTPT